jgi:AcrR family transcriptional regulator
MVNNFEKYYKIIDYFVILCNNLIIIFIPDWSDFLKKNIERDNNKESRLLNTAFKLFTEKGVKDTSIQEIVDNANVAKGTFYLYFKDKYEIRDILIARKSHKLFNDSLKELRKNYIKNLSDQVVFIINYVIDELSKRPLLIKFISKIANIFFRRVKKIFIINKFFN